MQPERPFSFLHQNRFNSWVAAMHCRTKQLLPQQRQTVLYHVVLRHLTEERRTPGNHVDKNKLECHDYHIIDIDIARRQANYSVQTRD